MKVTALLISLAWLPAAWSQEPAPEVDEGQAPLKIDPARDLFDFATLNYNTARAEKDAEKKKSAYLGAARAFDKFLRRFPDNPKALEAWYFLGMSYRKLDETKASRTCFETAATTWQEGKFVEASALFLASDDYQAEKWRDAAGWFKIVAETTENDKIKHQALYRRFLCFDKLEDKGSMVLALQAVLANPGSPYAETARLSLARLYRDTSSPREAHDQFVLLARSRDAKVRAEATLQAALTAQKLGDRDLTKTWFREALEDPGLKDLRGKAQLALMNLHYQDEEWQKVIETFDYGSFQRDDKARLQTLVMAAKSHEALGHKEQVDRLYQQISGASPGSAASFEAAYRLLVRQHQQKTPAFARATENFLKTYAQKKEDDPKIHSARLLLAEHYYEKKEFAAALDHYRLLDLKKVDPSNALAVRFHVAKTQLALKNEKGALSAIEAFLTTFPDSPQSVQLRLERAELLGELGRETEAVDDFEAILKKDQDPELRRALILRLAALYREKEDWPQFAATQKKLLLLPGLDDKNAASANFWLGWNELRQKKNETALPYLRKARTLDPKTFLPKVGPLLVKNAYREENLPLLEEEINLLRKEAPEIALPPEILRWLGAKLAKDGQFARGWPFLHEGLPDEEASNSALLWKLYARSSLALEKNAEALRAATTLLALEKNAYRRAEALALKARAHTGLGQFDEARQATSDALDLRPEGDLNIRLRLLAGDIDVAADQPAAAIRHYIVVESTYAQTEADKKEARQKIIATLKAIGTPKALEMLADYQE